MTEFHIVHVGRLVGVADFLDEAKDCGDRMTGRRTDTAWTPAGEQVDSLGRNTGWKIVPVVRGPRELEDA